MKKFFKILLFSIVALMCLTVVSYAADKTEGDSIVIADAEGEDPYCGYKVLGGSAKLSVVADPYKEGNKVYYLESVVKDAKAWSYMWFQNLNFEAGETYRISYDALIETDANGQTVTNGSSSGCFAFYEINHAPGKSNQHGVSGGNVENGKWTTISMFYTVPYNIDTSRQMNFGIYANPVENCGTSMYLDNISVTKLRSKEADPDTFTVLCLGNSVLIHNPSESIGWFGSWGMAASSKDKDYFNLMQQMFNADFPDRKNEWHKISIYALEKAINDKTDTDYTMEIATTFGAKFKDLMPDVVTFQFGENTLSTGLTAESFANAVEQCIDFCRKINPDVKIVVSTLAMGTETNVKSVGMSMAAANKAVPIVNLSQYNTPEYKAIGLFEHSGVAAHPGDKGMQKIAEEFYTVIKSFVTGEEIEKALTVNLNGVNVNFKTAPVEENETVLVPLKEVCKSSDYLVYTDATYKSLCVSYGTTSVIVPANEQYVMTNDKLIKLTCATKQSGDDLLVPIDFFSALGAKVTYNKSLNVVNIVK